MITIKEFQEMMKKIYYTRDNERGITGTFNWLKDEVEELEEALTQTNKNVLEEEFADVIAWLASLANILKIDLEIAILRKYNYHCPKCTSSPCKCLKM